MGDAGDGPVMLAGTGRYDHRTDLHGHVHDPAPDLQPVGVLGGAVLRRTVGRHDPHRPLEQALQCRVPAGIRGAGHRVATDETTGQAVGLDELQHLALHRGHVGEPAGRGMGGHRLEHHRQGGDRDTEHDEGVLPLGAGQRGDEVAGDVETVGGRRLHRRGRPVPPEGRCSRGRQITQQTAADQTQSEHAHRTGPAGGTGVDSGLSVGMCGGQVGIRRSHLPSVAQSRLP